MTYKIGGTTVINSSGQVDWGRIKNAPAFLTGTTAGIHNIGTGDLHVKFGLRIVGTTVQGTDTRTNCNCDCVCACFCDGG